MSGENILVIDDEPQIRRVMRTTLSSQGYVISEAMTGEEGVDAVRKNKPDLVLLDMNMPGIGGLEACKEIRQSTDAPIIMLTVRNAERKVAALDAGADDYVVKPFGIEELSRASAPRSAVTHQAMPSPLSSPKKYQSTSKPAPSPSAESTSTSLPKNSTCSNSSSPTKASPSPTAASCRPSGALTTAKKPKTSAS